MPSPFPGMDPYIETPEVWPDFHASLANEIRAWLNARVRPRYYASLEATFVYDEISVAESRQGRPDVSVLKPVEQAQNAMASVATAPYYITVSPVERRPVAGVWPVQLRDPLPTIPVPLLAPDPEAPLDLGAVVTSAYERGAYDIRLHYDQPPPLPELSSEEKAWVRELLQAREER